MKSGPRRYQTFFADLKRRGVFAAAGVYGAAAFVVIQAADFLIPALRFSDRVSMTIALVTILGFPFFLILAWLFDLRPTGVTRTNPAREGELEAIASGPIRARWPAGAFALTGIILLSMGAWWTAGQAGPLRGGNIPALDPEEPALAVLPCQSLSSGPGDVLLAEGMHEQILLNLQKISSLTSIGRSSVLQYRDARPPLRDLADSLGVRHVGECSVRKLGSQFRFTFLLSDGLTGRQVWAENYDRDLTAGNLFEIQGEVARRVAVALEAELTSEERELIGGAPTQNLEAYEFYLRGNSRFNWGYVERDIRYSIQMYQEAVSLDPSFAAAFARLSRAHGDMYWFSHDRSEDRRQSSRLALEAAIELAPEAPETLIAQGFYRYHVLLDYDAALNSFQQAEALRPNDPLVRAGMAYIQRRQGDHEGAAENLRHALRQDPFDGRYAHSLATTFLLMRKYDEAEPYLQQALRLAPQWPRPRAYASLLRLAANGDALAALSEIEAGIRAGALPTDDGLMLFAWFRADMFGRRFNESIQRMDSEAWPIVESQFFYLPLPLLKASLLRFQGNQPAAIAEFEKARAHLEEEAVERPTDERIRSALGLTYAGLGRYEDAVREGTYAVALMPPEKEANKGAYRVEDLAEIYAIVGEDNNALDALSTVLAGPGLYSAKMLAIDPRFAHLSRYPRFHALLEEHGGEGGI